MQRWATGYAVAWTPILTFAKRRLQLLERFEREIDPIAFKDERESIGVALVDPGLRLEVERAGLRITASADDLDLEYLATAVRGVFDVLEPQDAVLQSMATTRTFELAGADYHDERAEAARRATGCGVVAAAGRTFRPVDMSALVDFESPESVIQVEWGIVEGEELLERVTDPFLGRLGNHLRPPYSGEGPGPLPDVGLLADLVFHRKVGGHVTSWETLKHEIALADQLVSEIAQGVYDGYQRGRGSSEFSETA